MTEQAAAPAEAPPAEAPPAEAAPAEAAPAAEAPPEWMGDLPDDLKSNATLARFKSVEDLGRGFIETKKLATSKLSIPGEGATADQWNEVWTALGRPESADAYDVKTIELPVDAPAEQRAALAEATKPFKEFAHKLGLLPDQVTALSQFDLDRNAAWFAKGEEEVGALKEKLGKDYEPKLAAANKAYAQLFGDGREAIDLANELDRKVGSAGLLKGMMRLAEMMGEHHLVENDEVPGFGEIKDAEAKLTELQADKSWRDKFEAGDAVVVAQRARLLALAQEQAMRRKPTARQ